MNEKELIRLSPDTTKVGQWYVKEVTNEPFKILDQDIELLHEEWEYADAVEWAREKQGELEVMVK